MKRTEPELLAGYTQADADAAAALLKRRGVPPFECRTCGIFFIVLVVEGRDSIEVACPCCNSKYTLGRDRRLGKRVAIRVTK